MGKVHCSWPQASAPAKDGGSESSGSVPLDLSGMRDRSHSPVARSPRGRVSFFEYHLISRINHSLPVILKAIVRSLQLRRLEIVEKVISALQQQKRFLIPFVFIFLICASNCGA